MKKRKKILSVCISGVLLCTLLLISYAPPSLTLLRLSDFRSYDILWQREENGAVFYLTDNGSEFTVSAFRREPLHWQMLSSNSSSELAVISTSLPPSSETDTLWSQFSTYCLLAATEDNLNTYLDDIGYNHDIPDGFFKIDITDQHFTSGTRIIYLLFGVSEEGFSSSDMVALYQNRS